MIKYYYLNKSEYCTLEYFIKKLYMLNCLCLENTQENLNYKSYYKYVLNKCLQEIINHPHAYTPF